MSLPFYPVPKLDNTLTQLKSVLQPIVSHADYETFLHELEKAKPFLEQGQQLFESHANEQNNWASQGFQSLLLSLRAPIKEATWVGCLLKKREDFDDNLEYASALLHEIAKIVKDQPAFEAGVPLEKAQLTNLLRTNRIPQEKTDILVKNKSRNALVLKKNGAFLVEIINEEGKATKTAEIYNALKEIEAYDQEAESIVQFTALPRDTWASLRESILGDNKNGPVLRKFEDGIVTLVLEDEELDTSELAQGFEHFEKGTLRNFDQTLNIVVYKNNVVGLAVDHTVADGFVFVQFGQVLYHGAHRFDRSEDKESVWEALNFEQLPEIPKVNERSKKESLHLLDVPYLPDICKTLNEQRLFNSWVAIALQHAVNKTEKFLAVNPTHVRHFHDGRCDPTYIISNESNIFVKFLEAQNGHAQELKNSLIGLELYSSAVLEYKKRIHQTKQGFALGPHVAVIRSMLPPKSGDLKKTLEMFAKPAVVLTGLVGNADAIDFGCGRTYAEDQLIINYNGNPDFIRFNIRSSGLFLNQIDEFKQDFVSSLQKTLPFAIMLAIANQMNAISTLFKLQSKQIDFSKLQNTRFAIHGGAGDGEDLPPEVQSVIQFALYLVMLIGADAMLETNDSGEVVAKMVAAMENCFLFNAGKGAVLNCKGEHELEASIMDGKSGKAGAVACIKRLKNPIIAAQKVMRESQHILLSGDGAEEFCSDLEKVPNSYFETEHRKLQLNQPATSHVQTVGAVALDGHGKLTSATSTGGVVNKQKGRIGDTCIIGAGTYANEKIAVSCTGDGEEFLRQSIASKVATTYELLPRANLVATCQSVLDSSLKGKLAGLISVDSKGDLACLTNAKMYCAYIRDGQIHVELVSGDAVTQQLDKNSSKIVPPKSWKQPKLHPSVAITNEWYSSVFRMQNTIFHAAVDYFNRIHGYSYVMTPISTNTISSPMGLGSDSLPVSIDLFDQQVYLADSMQFTLEYFLRMDKNLPGTYYVSPSFRGEDPDSTHLNQFYHIECELLGNMDNAISIAEGFVIHIIRALLSRAEDVILQTAGTTEHLIQLAENYEKLGSLPRITLEEALKLVDRSGYELVEENRPEIGKKLTRSGEKALIAKHGGAVWLTEMDHLSTPFYQAYVEGSNKTKAKAADLLIGMGETLGLGERHETAEEAIEALAHHQVPTVEYEWYINMRRIKPLKTSGWGLGSERFICWVMQHDDVRDIQILPRLKGAKFVP